MSKSSAADSTALVDGLIDFIARSPTPFHATQNAVSLLVEHGFTQLDEAQEWNCRDDGKYVVSRNDSSVIAFQMSDDLLGGINMIGAHTDSPCLRIKPNPEVKQHGYLQLGVEVYGGALLHPWLDRDLSIAGRISGITADGDLFHQLVDMRDPVAVIPNLAIHLDREANKNRAINAQKHLPIILGQQQDKSFKQILLDYCEPKVVEILDYELSCYDTQTPSRTGLNGDFVCAARLDNLLSTYVGVRAMIDRQGTSASLLVATDHEEVGSASTCGAQGPFLRSVLERITNGAAELTRVIGNSTLLSCDNAHGIHPNYSDKHDQNHGPILNQGPVIKVNANQRYASNSIGSAKFQRLCNQQDIPVQHFVVRSDMGCGSTIGPITASELGVETLDIGVPQWAMHSIRETAGCKDIEYLHKALCALLT